MKFGPADQITLVRAVLVAALAGLVARPATPAVAWSVVFIAIVALLLDGVDGWVARRTATASAFGTRFDMETDAALILVLAVLVWQYGKAGPWVLAAGLLRYIFVAAGWVWPWMRRPLTPTSARAADLHRADRRADRRASAADRAAGEHDCRGPRVGGPLLLVSRRYAVAVASCRLTWRLPRCDTRAARARYAIIDLVLRLLGLAAAVFLLNASLTFQSAWPTPGIRWRGALSIELVAFVLLLLAARLWFARRSPKRVGEIGAPSRRAIRWVAALWLLLVLGPLRRSDRRRAIRPRHQSVLGSAVRP